MARHGAMTSVGGTVSPIKAGRVAAVMAAAVGFLAVGASAASERAAAPGPAPAPLTSVGPGAEQDARHELTAVDAEAWLNGLLTYGLKSGDIAGSVIVVVKDGHILFEKGYGYSDVAKRTPMDPERTLVPHRVDLEALHLDRGHAAGRAGQARSRPQHQRLSGFQHPTRTASRSRYATHESSRRLRGRAEGPPRDRSEQCPRPRRT